MRFSGMIVVSVLLLLDTVGHAVGFAQQSRCPEETRSDDFATRFVIHNGAIRMPAGAFLLVRKTVTSVQYGSQVSIRTLLSYLANPRMSRCSRKRFASNVSSECHFGEG